MKVSLEAWTKPLDAEPEPVRVDLQLENADYNVDLTPGEARAVAAALLEMAETESAPARPGRAEAQEVDRTALGRAMGGLGPRSPPL